MPAENPRGIDALQTLPFREVVLPFDEALSILTGKTIDAFKANLQIIIDHVDTSLPDGNVLKQHLELMKSIVQQVPPGGSSMSGPELDIFYDKPDIGNYRRGVEYIMKDVFPFFMAAPQKQNREPGIICLGYLTDLLGIINPEVASYEAGVATVIDVMRSPTNKMTALLFGAMVDDALKLRGSPDGKTPFDPYIDREAVTKFQEAFLKLATPQEIKQFNAGVNLPPPGKDLRTTGFSAN